MARLNSLELEQPVLRHRVADAPPGVVVAGAGDRRDPVGVAHDRHPEPRARALAGLAEQGRAEPEVGEQVGSGRSGAASPCPRHAGRATRSRSGRASSTASASITRACAAAAAHSDASAPPATTVASFTGRSLARHVALDLDRLLPGRAVLPVHRGLVERGGDLVEDRVEAPLAAGHAARVGRADRGLRRAEVVLVELAPGPARGGRLRARVERSSARQVRRCCRRVLPLPQ